MYFLCVENVGFHKNFPALPKVCRDETVQMVRCLLVFMISLLQDFGDKKFYFLKMMTEQQSRPK